MEGDDEDMRRSRGDREAVQGIVASELAAFNQNQKRKAAAIKTKLKSLRQSTKSLPPSGGGISLFLSPLSSRLLLLSLHSLPSLPLFSLSISHSTLALRIITKALHFFSSSPRWRIGRGCASIEDLLHHHLREHLHALPAHCGDPAQHGDRLRRPSFDHVAVREAQISRQVQELLFTNPRRDGRG